MSALFGTMTVYVAVVEYPEIDVETIASSDLDEVKVTVHTEVSDWIRDTASDLYPDDLRAYVEGEGRTADWEEFYDVIDEYANTPWVTFSQHEIEIR